MKKFLITLLVVAATSAQAYDHKAEVFVYLNYYENGVRYRISVPESRYVEVTTELKKRGVVWNEERYEFGPYAKK